MNSHAGRFLATAVAAFLFSGLVFVSTAGAAERFLASPVTVQPDPVLKSPSGGFDFVEADSGEAVAVWGESGGLWTSVRLPGGSFQPPVLAAPGVAFSANPDLAITPDGYTVMVWRNSVGPESQVFRAVRAPGAAGFGPALKVSDEQFQTPNLDAHVDVDDDRNALIVWKGRDADGDENSTRVRKRFLNPDGSVNGAISNVSAVSPNGVSSPRVVVGPTGYSLVTWVVGDTVTGDPATCWMGPGGASPDIQIFDASSGWVPNAAVDAEGNAVIAHKVGGDVIGNSRPTGAGKDFIIDQGLDLPGTNSYTPQVAMDRNGRTTVAFEYFAGGKEGIQTVDRPAGGTEFFGATTKAVPESDTVSDVGLAVGGAGLAIIGFTREDDRVYTAARDAGSPQFGVPAGPVSPVGVPTGIVIPGADANGKGIVTFSSLDIPADDYSLSALPYDDVPVAGDLSIPEAATVGTEVEFSVVPGDAWAEVTKVEWQLDEGVTKSGAKVSHGFASPGERMVVVTLTDTLGNQTQAGGPIQITAIPPDQTRPKLTKLSMLKKKSKRGRKNAFHFTLSERARVQVKIKRVSKGRGKAAQGSIVRKSVAAGKRRIGFKGKVRGRKLKPGRYKATLVATDAAGNKSKPRFLRFRIIR